MKSGRRIMRSRTIWNVPGILRRALCAWILSAAVSYLLLPMQLRDLSDLSGLRQMSLARSCLICCGLFILMTLLSAFSYFEKWERSGMIVGFLVLSGCALFSNFSLPLLGVILLLMLIFFGFALYGWDGRPEAESIKGPGKKRYLCITILLTALFFLFVSAWTVGRIYSFNTPSYDFGIFSQMFYSMKEIGLPLTTLERDGLLSHFAVHVSPIYYLMLPFYILAPYPATLQILQAAVLASAVIPAWKTARHFGLNAPARMLCCALLLLYPAYSGGTSYDLHENCFLMPLLLWLLYSIEKRNLPLIALFSFLTLTVKEDASVYVAVIALWLIIRCALHGEKRFVFAGIGMLAGSIAWFLLATGYLAAYGDGVMSGRYKNFFFEDSSSLLTVVKAVFLNPMKAIYECIESEKLEFILLTLLPLLGLPLFTRRYERYILLIPYILINLMSDYQYQHDIYFQYTFGSAALLLYLTIANLSDIRVNWKRLSALGCAAAVSVACFGMTVLPKGISYPAQCVQYRSYYQNIRAALEEIPKEASVAATTFYTVFLSQRETIYDIRYCSTEHLLSTEYVVMNANSTNDYKKYNTDGQSNGYHNLIQLLEENGYELYKASSNLVIYRKTASN